ncbi:uncharacterized protein BT62DRAFT_938328 [Guyanagaster necrorhizus]|uniref:Uncharacterized protein n=1 Tax=Guyanagaster necrorhizus TaxID=856835 RepID=A0A9P7VGI1_9AGAR|nr:uncharacterized protein BT62DRAFT_938328 [Guyanagaster necrorhizus MCA 3950]KAG7440132.1 hypothetical protein BT62DRAFT_938328 [Guyanagaster necrorhizus MCA 3950]
MASSDVDSCCGLPDCDSQEADQPCSCCSSGNSLEIDDTPAVQSRVDCAANAAESKQQVFIREVR